MELLDRNKLVAPVRWSIRQGQGIGREVLSFVFGGNPKLGDQLAKASKARAEDTERRLTRATVEVEYKTHQLAVRDTAHRLARKLRHRVEAGEPIEDLALRLKRLMHEHLPDESLDSLWVKPEELVVLGSCWPSQDTELDKTAETGRVIDTTAREQVVRDVPNRIAPIALPTVIEISPIHLDVEERALGAPATGQLIRA